MLFVSDNVMEIHEAYKSNKSTGQVFLTILDDPGSVWPDIKVFEIDMFQLSV